MRVWIARQLRRLADRLDGGRVVLIVYGGRFARPRPEERDGLRALPWTNSKHQEPN